MDDQIEWGPPPQGGNGRWGRVARVLAERPGRWGKVAEYERAEQASSAARQLRRAGCQTANRVIAARCFGVWARWPAVSHCGAMLDDVDSRPLRAVQ